jgi:hypothetical protein
VSVLLRIRSVEALEGRRLLLGLTNGQTIERDVSDLLSGPVFDAVREDDAMFRGARVRFGTVAWPGGADLDPDVLIWGGAAPADPAARPAAVLKPLVPA